MLSSIMEHSIHKQSLYCIIIGKSENQQFIFCSGVGLTGPTLPEMYHRLLRQPEWNSVHYHKHISIIS